MGQPQLESADLWQIIEAISTCLAAVLAGFVLFQAQKIFKSQQHLTEKIHKQQMTLAQRQLFIPLFEQFKDIATVDPQSPVWVDVIKAVNFLDLLGICWEGQLVDEQILFRVFREFVIDTYDRIKRCENPPPNVGKDGKTMLRESRAATSLYIFLMSEHVNRDRPHSIRRQ